MLATQQFQSRITKKGQATIPLFIRQTLKIKPQEKIEFSIDKYNNVSLKKAPSYEQYSALVSEEWGSEADNDAYNDL